MPFLTKIIYLEIDNPAGKKVNFVENRSNTTNVDFTKTRG
jgi:hypothetical protein